jgi:hypothetical protein
VRSVLVSACWGVARRLLVMRRSWVRFPQAAPAFVQVRATFRVLRADPSPPAWDGDRPRARARALQRRTPRFAYIIGVSPRLVFTTLTCRPVPEPDDSTRTPGSVRFPVCLDLIAKARRSADRAPAARPPSGREPSGLLGTVEAQQASSLLLDVDDHAAGLQLLIRGRARQFSTAFGYGPGAGPRLVWSCSFPGASV